MAGHQLYLFTLGHLVSTNQADGTESLSQVPGYLIRSARGKNILVDSGNPKALIGAESAAPWSPNLGVRLSEDEDIVAQLARVGLRPKDIDLLVTSHFDFDHCGRHDVFAEAQVPVVVQRRHFEWALSRPKRYDPDLFRFPGWNYELVDGDTEVERGIVLLETSGHAIGHQSVFVDTANGPVLLAIDAIARPEIAQTREIPEWFDSAEETNRSIDKLMHFALDYRAYTIFGHEKSQWDTLPHAPRAFTR